MFKVGDKVNIIDSDILGEVYHIISDSMLVVMTEDGYKVETSVYNVCSRTKPEDYLSSIGVGRKFSPPSKDKPSAKKSKPTKKEFEYDLHAESLLGSFRGIGPTEVLPLQLDEVRSILRKHAGSTVPVVLIHGHGDGKLRTAILRLIRTEFTGWTAEDASFSRYGYQGALKLRNTTFSLPHSES